MALGTITVSKQGSVSAAPTFLIKLSIAGLGAYATGGLAIKAAIETKLERAIDIVHVEGRGGQYLIGEYNSTTDLMLVYDDATGLEVADTTVLSGTFQVAVWGK